MKNDNFTRLKLIVKQRKNCKKPKCLLKNNSLDETYHLYKMKILGKKALKATHWTNTNILISI